MKINEKATSKYNQVLIIDFLWFSYIYNFLLGIAILRISIYSIYSISKQGIISNFYGHFNKFPELETNPIDIRHIIINASSSIDRSVIEILYNVDYLKKQIQNPSIPDLCTGINKRYRQWQSILNGKSLAVQCLYHEARFIWNSNKLVI